MQQEPELAQATRHIIENEQKIKTLEQQLLSEAEERVKYQKESIIYNDKAKTLSKKCSQLSDKVSLVEHSNVRHFQKVVGTTNSGVGGGVVGSGGNTNSNSNPSQGVHGAVNTQGAAVGGGSFGGNPPPPNGTVIPTKNQSQSGSSTGIASHQQSGFITPNKGPGSSVVTRVINLHSSPSAPALAQQQSAALVQQQNGISASSLQPSQQNQNQPIYGGMPALSLSKLLSGLQSASTYQSSAGANQSARGTAQQSQQQREQQPKRSGTEAIDIIRKHIQREEAKSGKVLGSANSVWK